MKIQAVKCDECGKICTENDTMLNVLIWDICPECMDAIIKAHMVKKKMCPAAKEEETERGGVVQTMDFEKEEEKKKGKLSQEDIEEIRRKAETGEKVSKIAKEYNVSECTIRQKIEKPISAGRTYRIMKCGVPTKVKVIKIEKDMVMDYTGETYTKGEFRVLMDAAEKEIENVSF